MCVTAFRGRAWGSTCLCGCVWARSAHTAPGAQGSVRAGAGCAAAPAGTKAGTKHSPALARRVGVSPSLSLRDASRRGRTRVPRRPPERPPHPFSLRRVAPYFSAYLPPSLFFVPLQLSPALSLSGSGSVLTGFLVVCFFLFPAPALPPRPNSRSFSVSVCFYSSISSYMCPSVSPCC